MPEEDHRDGWALRRCLEFLDRGVDRKRPLFLYVSFLKPHAGHNVPPGFEQLYDLNAMPVPQQPPKELVEPCHATGVNREGMYRSFWSQASPAAVATDDPPLSGELLLDRQHVRPDPRPTQSARACWRIT